MKRKNMFKDYSPLKIKRKLNGEEDRENILGECVDLQKARKIAENKFKMRNPDEDGNQRDEENSIEKEEKEGQEKETEEPSTTSLSPKS